MLRKVRYQRAPDVFPSPSINGCFCKSRQWEYEREWRCVRVFKRAEPRIVTVDPTLITEIIIGHKMETWRIAQLVSFLYAFGISGITVKLFMASPSRRLWKFSLKPISMSPCQHCHGCGYILHRPE